MIDRFMNFLNQWFRPRSLATEAPAEAPPTETQAEATLDMEKTQNLIRRATETTAAVAQEVGNHQATIQTLNTALSAVAQGDAAAVASIVCNLLMANQGLQGQLERAELKMQAHSRQLQDAVTAARTDSLTGLMNRRALDEELIRCLTNFQSRGRPATLMLLDVDRFKRFNDVHGHVGGDHALVYVAEALRAQLREHDIVARFGGEEFIILFEGATAAAVQQRAEQVRALISQGRVVFDGREGRLTASAGLADVLANDSIESWLKRADAALYAAKNGGRNCAYLNDTADCKRIELSSAETALDRPEEAPTREAAAELAADAFADTTFVSQVVRRIAEWRRGGATFSVLLARLDRCPEDRRSADDFSRQLVIRAALLLARDCVRNIDVLTRWTDDGLAVLLPGTGVVDAKAMARRLRAALARCETPSPGGPRVSMCMGIAEGIEGNDASRVLNRAWLALNSAQAAAPGMIYVHDGVKTAAVKALALAR